MIFMTSFSEIPVFFFISSKEILYDQANGKIRFNDNKKAHFGSDNDLEIVHTGTHGYINNSTIKESLKKGTEMSSKIIQKIGARLS